MNKLFELRFGSHLYGTQTESSDLDLKSVYLPEPREIVLGRVKKTISTTRKKQHNERNTKDDVDIEIFSLDRYLQLLTEGQTVALDVLFAGMEMYTYTNEEDYWIFSQIYNAREKLISKNVTAFLGYARTQASKYGIKGSRMEALKQTLALLKTFHIHDKLGDHSEELIKLVVDNSNIVSLEKTPIIWIRPLLAADKVTFVQHLEVCNRKLPFGASVKFAVDVLQKIYDEYGSRSHKAHLADGIDWKACSHAVRVNTQGIELLKTGHITFPRPERELLIKIKTGQMKKEEVFETIEQGLVDLVETQKTSTLRETPDLEWVENFVESIYSGIVKNTL